ncbi:MAG: hypothetical protein ACRDSJ_03035 [Rubrobacteraceae bacterium]
MPDERKLVPHPEYGDLPPCTAGSKTGRPCERAGEFELWPGHYLCGPHLRVRHEAQGADEARNAIHLGKRMLWMAHEGGFERLEHHIGDAIYELEDDLQQAEERLAVRIQKADEDG